MSPFWLARRSITVGPPKGAELNDEMTRKKPGRVRGAGRPLGTAREGRSGRAATVRALRPGPPPAVSHLRRARPRPLVNGRAFIRRDAMAGRPRGVEDAVILRAAAEVIGRVG